MSRQRRPNHPGKHRPPHRITPVWQEEIDRKALARVFLLLAMHLDEKQRSKRASSGADHPADDHAEPPERRAS